MKTLLVTWSDGSQTTIAVRRFRFIKEDMTLHVQHEDYEWSEMLEVIAVEFWVAQ